MVFFNYSTQQMAAKVVYYGPGLGGKTSNLQYIYDHTSKNSRGEMVSLDTDTDRTLFFDLLPIDVGTIGGFETRIQLYTVPGQVFYNATRKLVLKGVDGVVFVADSQRPMIDANRESFENLVENLRIVGLKPEDVPIVLQYNKRDLPGVLSIDELNAVLNQGNWPVFEASALSGKGIFETLTAISKLTLKALRAKVRDTGSSRPQGRPAPVPPQPAISASPPRVQAAPVSHPATTAASTPSSPAPVKPVRPHEVQEPAPREAAYLTAAAHQEAPAARVAVPTNAVPTNGNPSGAAQAPANLAPEAQTAVVTASSTATARDNAPTTGAGLTEVTDHGTEFVSEELLAEAADLFPSSSEMPRTDLDLLELDTRSSIGLPNEGAQESVPPGYDSAVQDSIDQQSFEDYSVAQNLGSQQGSSAGSAARDLVAHSLLNGTALTGTANNDAAPRSASNGFGASETNGNGSHGQLADQQEALPNAGGDVNGNGNYGNDASGDKSHNGTRQATSGHVEMSRQIEMNLPRKSLMRARRISMLLQFEDEDENIVGNMERSFELSARPSDLSELLVHLNVTVNPND